MKKLILLLGVIGVITLMTSCWDTNDRGGESSVVYIMTDDNSRVFGFASTSRLITNEVMQLGMIGTTSIFPGEFYILSYNWNVDELGRTPLQFENVTNQAFNVVINPAVLPVHKRPLNMLSEAPEISGITFNGVILFTTIFTHLDYWIFQYAYTGTGTPNVTFYKRTLENESPNNIATIEIDIRLTGISQGQQGQQPSRGEIALNLTELREKYQQTAARTVRVRFRFYQEQPTGDPDEQTMIFANNRDFIEWQIPGTPASGQ